MAGQNIAGREILTVAEMYAADSHAMENGVSGIELMENAGRGLADAILRQFLHQRVHVLCGPGNNGGDGFVVARMLQDAGWPVRLFLLGDQGNLQGDAAHMAGLWTGKTEPLDENALDGADLIVDALFGAGLTRPLEGVPAQLAERANALPDLNVVAVDVPSGLDGDTGEATGVCFNADLTVTFHRPKPGHLLMPGRQHCGDHRVVDIGIPDSALTTIKPVGRVNGPDIWRDKLAWPDAAGHKYTRGHLLVNGGGMTQSGAARLAAVAGLRVGAGLVTCICPPAATMVYAHHLTSVMLRPAKELSDVEALLADQRLNAIVVGPANGVDDRTRDIALAALKARKSTVLDADALTVFQDDPGVLFGAIQSPTIMTPHTGEFRRLFPADQDRLSAACDAAGTSGAVVVYKGADTIIASPDGRYVINNNAPSWLATAGSGDTLAGLCGGLLAQGVPAFEAACAAVWTHGDAARRFGPGLIADDMAGLIPSVLRDLMPTR